MSVQHIIKAKDEQIKDLTELLKAAIRIIEETPCDSDIFDEQIQAWGNYETLNHQYRLKYPEL